MQKLLIILSFTLGIYICSFSANARPVLVDASPRKIDIDHNFRGTEVLVYGVQNDVGNVIIIVRGPKTNQVLREKGKVAGIWTNINNLEVENFYNFYAVASTIDLKEIDDTTILKNLEIGAENINFSTKKQGVTKVAEGRELKDAAIRLMRAKELYTEENYEILYWGDSLFRSFIEFPKNITKGMYNIDVYLVTDGQITGFQTLPISVDKVGFEEMVYNTAYEQPYLYGFVCVFIAIAFGLFVGLVFGRK